MPRQTFDIKEFKYGVISALDEEDIPPESASDSLNIDGDVGEGVLQGIATDTEYQAPTGSALVNVRLGEFIEHDGIYDLIYHDKNVNTISVVTDFYNTNSEKKKLDLISSLSSDNVTMVKTNREVHIGVDGNYAYWVGRPDHGLFSYGASWAIASIAEGTGADAGLVRVTTTPTHAIKNGDIIRISGATGTDSASINGIWVAKSCDNFAKTFVLTGSTFTGTILTAPGTAEFYISYEYAHCINYTGDSEGEFLASDGAENNADGYFQNGIYYKWGLSFTYDGYQESPIEENCADVCGAESNYYPITITAYRSTVTTGADPGGNSDGIGTFNKRITAVNLYRADSSDGVAANTGLYRLVASIDINNTNWATSTNDKTIIVNDYGTYYTINAVPTIYPSNPVSYQENSGMPEVLTDSSLYYALSTAGNGYHFVTKATQSTLAGSETRNIYKSKYLRYDMFDYYSDFLPMPEAITAIHFYEGKLFAFSLNKAYRINPDGLYVEDVYEDVGAQGQRAVHSNEYGMFVGNSSNAWMYQGGGFIPIGNAIRRASNSNSKSWRTLNFIIDATPTLSDLIVTSDGRKGYVLFINERDSSGDKIFAWAYHPSKKRWDAWSFAGYASSANAGVFKGKDGEIYLSYGTATQTLMRNTGYQLWEWYSQELTFGETRQNKSITMIKVDATGTVTLTYGVDGTAPATSGTSDALINTYAKSLRIKLNAASGTNYVDSLEIVYRPLVGAR